MNTVLVLKNLRAELEAAWSDNTGGYSQFVVDSLAIGDPSLSDYLEMVSADSGTTPKARSLATQALREVETDANFLAACGINAEDWEDLT